MTTRVENRDAAVEEPVIVHAEVGESEAGTEKEVTDSAPTAVGRSPEDFVRAPWRARVWAYAVDVICPAATLLVLGLTVANDPPNQSVQIACGVAAAVVVGFVAWNVVYRQGATGRTIGKLLAGIRTVRPETASPPGALRALGREVAHVIDTVPLLAGWLWPLRDRRGQSFADKLADTVVITDAAAEAADPRRHPRTAALGIFAAFAAALVGLAATQYFHDYLRNQATAEISGRAQDIAQQSTVELLSYHAATVEKDLGAASSKLTGSFKDYYDNYVKSFVIPTAKEKSVDTQARSVGSALVSADDRHATVLVFINQTTTTADNPQPAQMASTVRVQLTKVGNDWLIAEFEPI